MNVTIKNYFDAHEFRDKFLGRTPVLYKNVLSEWPACSRWSYEYFKSLCPDLVFEAKYFESDGVRNESMTMSEYIDLLNSLSVDYADPVPYCHDVPIFKLCEKLVADVNDQFISILPGWYQTNWTDFVQFFISFKGAITPLHFDTLMTSNLFFQVSGRKIFQCIEYRDADACKRRGWRWFDDDLNDATTTASLNSDGVQIITAEVEAGDIFYLPPKLLHHVQSLSDSISFNLDFHTKQTVLDALAQRHDDMPQTNQYYNRIVAKALFFKDPSGYFFDKYSSYLNYQS